MGRSWGTNLMPGNPAILTLASDTPCTAGVKTTVLSYGSAPYYAAGAAGGWYMLAQLALAITLGAVAPSALVISLDLALGGANKDTYTVPPGLLVNLAVLLISATLVVPNSGSLWYPTGDNPEITVNPTGQAITVNAVGTRCVLALPQGL
jgi:hypothetical protein